MIESAEQLLQALEADAGLAALIGVYTFEDEGTAPALAILGSNEYVDGLAKVEGLELIIQRTPKSNSRPVYGGCVLVEKAWTVHLIQYDQGTAGTEAADLMLSRFPGASYSSLGASSVPEIAGVDQLVVSIPANVPG